MNQENTERIFKRFAGMFKPELGPMNNLMCFGFDVGDGWYDLIYKLCEDIEPLVKDEDNFMVVQVKEKFGGLRFYVDFGSDELFDLIEAAECKSFHICEDCGEPGCLRVRGTWFFTSCEAHSDGCSPVSRKECDEF